jgi:hypothetical protein
MWYSEVSLRRGLPLLLLMLYTAGCYTYRPAETLRPGNDVRARLNTEAAVRRSAGLDEPITTYSGRLVRETPESITLDVLIERDPSQFSAAEIRDVVTLERSEIQSLMVRELSTSRSIVFAAAATVGAVAIITGITTVIGGSEDESDPPPPAASVSLFRLQHGPGSWIVRFPFGRAR